MSSKRSLPAFDNSAVSKQRNTNSGSRGLARVLWYNGRRQVGKLLADDGQEMWIPVGGAVNRNVVPLTAHGLMHGTTVRCLPVEQGKAGERLQCISVRPCVDIPQPGLSCGVHKRHAGKESQSHFSVADVADLGFMAGIFDGHGGGACAGHVAQLFPSLLHAVYSTQAKQLKHGLGSLSAAKETDLISTAISETFQEAERNLMLTAQEMNWTDGSSAVVALMAHGFEAPGQSTVSGVDGGVAQLFLAWCGDSRGIVLSGKEARCLTRDHVPGRKDEYERLKRAGGKVLEFDGLLKVGRRDKYQKCKEKRSLRSLNGLQWLSISRSFGDIRLKAPHHIVTCEPELAVHPLSPGDWAVVLFCSGVTKALTNQDVLEICWQVMITQELGPVEAAQEIVACAQGKGADSNLSVVVMRLGWTCADLLQR